MYKADQSHEGLSRFQNLFRLILTVEVARLEGKFQQFPKTRNQYAI